jgi:hypothetical protein
LVRGFSLVPELSIRWRSLSVENRGASALWGRTHDVMGQLEYDSILPLPHLGNKDRWRSLPEVIDCPKIEHPQPHHLQMDCYNLNPHPLHQNLNL